MALQVKWLLLMPASLIRVPAQILAAPFPIQLPATAPEKAMDNGPSTWLPVNYLAHSDEAPDFDLVQNWLFWAIWGMN